LKNLGPFFSLVNLWIGETVAIKSSYSKVSNRHFTSYNEFFIILGSDVFFDNSKEIWYNLAEYICGVHIWVECWTIDLSENLILSIDELVTLVCKESISWIVTKLHRQKSENGIGLSHLLTVAHKLKTWKLISWNIWLKCWPLRELDKIILPLRTSV